MAPLRPYRNRQLTHSWRVAPCTHRGMRAPQTCMRSSESRGFILRTGPSDRDQLRPSPTSDIYIEWDERAGANQDWTEEGQRG